jgi:hypothetical protein
MSSTVVSTTCVPSSPFAFHWAMEELYTLFAIGSSGFFLYTFGI